MLKTRDQILAELNAKAREVNNRDYVLFDPNPREVLKDKKIKRQNDISRDGEEKSGEKVSDETCPLALQPTGIFLSSLQEAKGEGLVSISPATTSSRDLVGISAQQAKTKKGIKVHLTLQTQEQADNNTYIAVTAELKRSDRIRELKPYAGDSIEFAQDYEQAKQEIRESSDKKNICIGRIHQRGSRSQWIADMMVMGYMSGNILETIRFWLGNRYYDIKMDHELSEKQQQLFHCGGIYGTLVTRRTVPTFETLAPVRF